MTDEKQVDIWPGTKIEVLGLTGHYGSGKTLFGATIDPSKTRYYDFEKSGGTYDGLGMDRVDVPDILHERHKGGYTPRNAFEWWYGDIKKVPSGKYTVIFTDPITDIEEGLVEWVKARHSEWGFKSALSFESTGGIFWAKVKSEWKRVLADLAARCQTFVFTAHLKKVWKHGRPTDKAIPKGKSTLMELSSLYLFLDRDPPGSGKQPPMIPGADVLKSRLATTRVTEEGVKVLPILPPRLKEATPDVIRKYIKNPPDYSKLKAGERVKERNLSEDDRLELQRDIAADERAAKEAELEAAQTKKAAEDAKAQAKARLRPSPDRAQEIRKLQEEGSKNGSSKEEAPQDEPSKDGPELLEEDARKAGVVDRVRKAIHGKLADRKIKVDNDQFGADLLTDEEFKAFRKGVDKVLASK